MVNEEKRVARVAKRSKPADKQGKSNGKVPDSLKPYAWKPGQSGNPKGRTPKALTLTPRLIERLDEVCPGDKQGRTWGEVVIEATLVHAAKGNTGALRELWNRIDGMPAQTIDLDGKIGLENLNVEGAKGRLLGELARIAARQQAKETTRKPN